MDHVDASDEFKEAEAEVISVFNTMASGAVGEKGIFPLPMVAKNKDGVLEVSAMAVGTDEIMSAFLKKIVKRQVDVIMVGRDCWTKPGQGTEFKDVLVCLLWSAKSDWTEQGEWKKWFRVGVVNYQPEPMLVRPIDWRNDFWTRTMLKEIEEYSLVRNTPSGPVPL